MDKTPRVPLRADVLNDTGVSRAGLNQKSQGTAPAFCSPCPPDFIMCDCNHASRAFYQRLSGGNPFSQKASKRMKGGTWTNHVHAVPWPASSDPFCPSTWAPIPWPHHRLRQGPSLSSKPRLPPGLSSVLGSADSQAWPAPVPWPGFSSASWVLLLQKYHNQRVSARCPGPQAPSCPYLWNDLPAGLGGASSPLCAAEREVQGGCFSSRKGPDASFTTSVTFASPISALKPCPEP